MTFTARQGRRALVVLLALESNDLARAAESSPPDLRLVATGLILAERPQEALTTLEKALQADPDKSRGLGLDYFRGRLLERLGRDREAAEAFAESLSSGLPALRAHSRLRLAETQARLGHPEVAAGLVATLLGSEPPSELLEPAIRLLRDSLADGGDCRVAPVGLGRTFPSGWRRRLDLVRAECGVRRGDAGPARETFLRLLRDDTQDEVALEAAEGYTRLGVPGSSEAHRLLGLAFHQHREFGRAQSHLEIWLARPGTLDFEGRYALERALFWQNRFGDAARGFGEMANAAVEPRRRAQTLYQQARSLELTGDLAGASAAFRRSYLADPRGEDAAAALLSALRVDFGRGLENDAIALLDKLSADPASRSATARGALFLAASDLVRGRADRAGRWLDTARLADAKPEEVAYWRGRWYEIGRKPESAVRAYAEAVMAAPWSPWASSSRGRLAAEALAKVAADSGATWAKGTTRAELQLAWIVLGDVEPRGQRARETLRAAFLAEPRSAAFLRAQVLPAAEWPLWRQPLARTDELLLSLGGWSEGGSALSRHFPLENPSLALTAAHLAARGGNPQRSVGIAETLMQRVPPAVPPRLLPRALLEAVYPLPFREALIAEARKRGVDPSLLAAIVREESRFDPLATSAASARGLAQFVLPTAKELASRHGLGTLTARDLERPQVALALGAIYLGELVQRTGSVEQAVAAYNAGEPQAALWRKYCLSSEPEEYLSKVSFKETRAYLSRVLTSRNAYAELAR